MPLRLCSTFSRIRVKVSFNFCSSFCTPLPTVFCSYLSDVVAPEITDAKCGTDQVTLWWRLSYCQEKPMNYVVKYRKKASDARWNEIYDISGETYTIEDLLPSTQYILQVIAYTDCKPSTFSLPSEEKECKTTRGKVKSISKRI